ncbi:hypothetical protein BTO04_04915 [Polaribacter sp. SA4-10]|uniref:hypothetical protein n=1 Tax=Polaribacter sp. SA4-10 TaxID=754397 RepID=UPI000B3CE97A|nr:hypothetical protein [Polaribacter sp. SA4-10]ARV06082.1 hypothetical protein BTO04_04915 [Polaribacter sp. SA4-10]
MPKETRKVNVIYEELRDRTVYPFLLYIPKKYFAYFLEEEQVNQLHWAFDVLILARKEMDIIFIDKQDESQEILNKRSVLNENLFDLVDYKIELKPAQFSFLIDKYQVHLFVMHHIAELMLIEVNKRTDGSYKKHLAFFILQEEALGHHKRSVGDDFPEHRKTQEEEDYMRANIIDNFKLPIIEQEEIIPPEVNIKKKKEKLITDLEAQDFLLEIVFKIVN